MKLPNTVLSPDTITLTNTDTLTLSDPIGNENTLTLTDMVNAPPHYIIKEGLEWIDIREALADKLMEEKVVLPYADYSDWDRALEYLVRGPWKNNIEDYRKSRFYINRLLDRMEERSNYNHEENFT